jgi:hypothetical protein
MISAAEKKFLARLVLFSGVFTGLIISPAISNDPINIPKLCVLLICGSIIIGVVAAKINAYWKLLNKNFAILLSLFLLQMLAVLLFSGAPFNQQFFGTFGRNTGFLAYSSLIAITLGASVVANAINLRRIASGLVIMGSISIVYGLLQTTGNDPIKWNNPYNAVITFLGNPNFASSFLGICGIASFACLLGSLQNRIVSLLLVLQIALVLFLTLRSDSQQGVLVFGAGLTIVIFIYLSKHKNFSKPAILFPYVAITGTLGTLVLLATLKLGPLVDIIYKLSVRQRGFYWRAAREMMFSHPIFGVGLDSYGDWYFAKRSLNAAFITPLIQSNSAHNVFLDLGASGGFPLFIINILLSALTLLAINRIYRRQKEFDWVFTALLSAWIAYEAQAIISINQLGLGVWGWILMGSLIGFEYQTRNNSVETASERSIRKRARKETSTMTTVGAVTGLVIGSLIAGQIFFADANFRTALQSQDANKAISAALANPEDLNRTLQIASTLANNSLTKQANELLDHILKKNPRSFGAWELKYKLSVPNSSEWEMAKSKLKFLNPKAPIA